MKLDTHVHTFHSGACTVPPFTSILRESYNSPEGVAQVAQRRGMDLIAITDHDEISGALALGNAPGVVVGCEVTAEFPGQDVCVHLNVLGITEGQHRDIQRRRRDVATLLPYLQEQGIFTSLNHVASGVNGPLTAAHVAALVPWVNALEVINGSRLAAQNRTAACVAAACGAVGIAGSDAHTYRGVGLTWTEVPGARSPADFLAGLRAGRVRIGGRQGHFGTMAADMLRFALAFYRERAAAVVERPWSWQAHACLFGGVLGLPLVTLPLAGAYLHFLTEARFNRDLLFDLVARPARAAAQVPPLAA